LIDGCSEEERKMREMVAALENKVAVMEERELDAVEGAMLLKACVSSF